MNREGRVRWLIAAVAVAGLTWLILFARGQEGGGRRAELPAPVATQITAAR